jgi:hypothetical protein
LRHEKENGNGNGKGGLRTGTPHKYPIANEDRASTVAELSIQLQCTPRSVRRWLQVPGSPRKFDGINWSVSEWKKFIHDRSLSQTAQPNTDLRDQQITLQNRKLALRIAILERDYVPVAEMSEYLSTMMANVRNVLLQIPKNYAARLCGLPPLEIQTQLRAAIDDALSRLHGITKDKFADPAGLREDTREFDRDASDEGQR